MKSSWIFALVLVGVATMGFTAEFWANLKVILEYGGLPAVILLFGGIYLMMVNRQWTRTVSQMQAQFRDQQNIISQQQAIVLEVVQNNTAALVALSTKLGMGCMLFRRELLLEAAPKREDGRKNEEGEGRHETERRPGSDPNRQPR